MVAVAAAFTGASLLVATDRLTVDTVQIRRINPADAPVLDGDTSDRAWRGVKPFSLLTGEGGNFDGKGEARIEIRAVHDGTYAYFLFTWQDSTRSLKQLPLVKEADGWHLLHSGFQLGDEHQYNEDKFSVLLTTMDVTLAGGRTFHPGPQPVANAPATMSGRGLHYTEAGYADVWQWKATSGAAGWMDDAHFGPPLDPTPMQAANVVPYKGGFATDPGTANYRDNFAVEADASGGARRSRLVAPLRLPKVVAATTDALGDIDLDPNHGESDGARWFMTDQDSVPYSTDADALHPDRDRDPGRHPGRRIFRRSRRRSMRRPMGLRPLGARGETAARHHKQVRRADPKRRLHAGSCFRPQPDQTYAARAAHSYRGGINVKDLQSHDQR